MGFLDMLSGASEIGEAKGFDINKDDFQIKDADKLFGQTQDQYSNANKRGQKIEGKRDSFLGALEQSAMGTGPSLAMEQLKQTQDRTLAQQLAAVQAQRGGNGALGQRDVLRRAAEMNAQTANQGVTARLQEQQQNRQLYGQQLGQEQQAVDQMTQQYLAMGFDIRSAQQQALEDYNNLQVQQSIANNQINAENQRTRGQMTGALVGGLISGAATMGASSIQGAAMKQSANTLANAQQGMTAQGGFNISPSMVKAGMQNTGIGNYGNMAVGNYASQPSFAQAVQPQIQPQPFRSGKLVP